MTVQRPILRWHGGKWRVAPWILAHIPEHEAYVEPFGGGGSVLLRKPRSRLEVYNDLDGGVVNLFRVLRDHPRALAERVALTPFARDEFEAAYGASDDPVEAAARFLILSHMGFGSNGVHRATGFRAAGLRAGVLPVHNWCDMPAVIRSVAERLRGVVIERREAMQVMAANDGPSVVHYVDPPYLMSVRSDTGADYAHELTDGQHADLLAFLQDLQGTVILSGYASDLYDKTLSDWQRVEKETVGDRASQRVEVLWINRKRQGDFNV